MMIRLVGALLTINHAKGKFGDLATGADTGTGESEMCG